MQFRLLTLLGIVIIFFEMQFVSTATAAGMNSIVSQQISRNVSSMVRRNLINRILKPQLKIRNQSGTVSEFAISIDERLFALLHDDNTVRIWDAQQGIQRPIIKPKPQDISHIAVVSRLNVVLLASADGNIDIYDIYTGKLSGQLKNNIGEIVALSVTKDETLLVVAYENGDVVFWDVLQQRQKQIIKTDYGNDLTKLIVESNGLSFILAGEDGFIDRWNIEAGKKIATLPRQDDDIKRLWVGKDDGLVATFDDDEILQLLEGAVVSSKYEISDDFLALTLNQDLSLMAMATDDNSIKIINPRSQQLVKLIKGVTAVTHLQFINNSQQLIAADEFGVLHVYVLASGQEILKLISTNTGWTVVDNSGRFDSSELGMPNVSWVAEEFEIPLDSFSSNYYEPGLLATQIEQQAFINKQPEPIEAGIKLPPMVTIVKPEANQQVGQPFILSSEVQGMGGGVGTVDLYHNGKKVSASAQVSNQEKIVDGLVTKTVGFNVVPTAGTNTFKIIARNTTGIEGHSEALSIDIQGAKPKIKLHVFTIGVNKYQDPQLNLDYSVADGQSIAKIFTNKAQVRFDKFAQHKIYDQQATKQEILRQLKLKDHFNQDDVLVLYLAGHGLAIDGEWYFLPHETELKDSMEYFTQVGISATEIQEVLSENKAQKIFLMIDSCYSGASVQAFRDMQNSQRHFSRSVSKTAGIVVLAATRKDQTAAELSDLGHGLFTYIVSDGLKGPADFDPRNQQITAQEIANYTTEKMPALSRKYLGASQEPTAFSIGQDFILLRQD